MRRNDEALTFVYKTNKGKNKGSNLVIKSLIMGDILRRYGFDETSITAATLYVVYQEGFFPENYFAFRFGGDVTSLLITAIEPDKNLPWKDARKQQLKAIKDLPINNRLIIIAALIVDLEKERIQIQESGKYPLRTYEELENKRWYFESMLKVLGDGFEHEILDRLEENISYLYYNNDFEFTPPVINSKKLSPIEELKSLKEHLESTKPFIFEFTNNPKRTLLEIFEEFFQNDGIQIKVINPLKSSNKYENEYIADNNGINNIGMNLLIASEVSAGLLSKVANGKNVILVEQGLFNRLMWLKRYFDSGEIPQKEFKTYMKYYLTDLEQIINYTTVSYSNSFDSQKNYQAAIENVTDFLNGIDPEHPENPAACKVVENLLPMFPKKQAIGLQNQMKTLKNTA